MEVPGRRQDPCQNKGSQGDVLEFCLPCESEGQHVPANGGFCQTCEHYLCVPCYNAHIIPLPCKNHVLIDKNSMPKSNLAKSKPASNTCTRPCTIRCSYHRDKVIEFFCSAHNEIVCSVCAVLKHKPCIMDYIPDVAMSYKDSQEYKDLVDNLKGLKKDVQSLSDDIKENMSHLPKSVETALDDIRQFRMEINEYLNKKEQELVLAARKLENQDSEILGKLVFGVNELGTELSGLTKQLTSAKYVVSDLFVTSKQMTKDLDLLLDKFTGYTVENKKIEYQFKSGDFLSNLLSSDAALGAVDRISQTQPSSYFRRRTTQSTSCMRFRSGLVRQGRDIDVKANKDKRDSVITGLTVLPTHRLLLVDSFNCSVKTADIRSSRIMSCLTLLSMPWDITTLPQVNNVLR